MKTHFEEPKIVRWVSEALSSRLGRPAHIRAQKNGEHWFVNDPAFSYLQVGLRSGVTDYRAGFMVEAAPAAIYFGMVHTPTIARVFRTNVTVEHVLTVLDQTFHFRRHHYLHYSSKREAKNRGNRTYVDHSEYAVFRARLLKHDKEVGLVSDLFPVLPNRGKGTGKARKAGHDFSVVLADRAAILSRKSNVEAVVNAAWPLFRCMYPETSPRRRDAILAAKLRTAGVERQCEFKTIKDRVIVGAVATCEGRIEGAHIKPDAMGGSDEAENGLWLCRYHHIATEGLLRGKRGSVRAVARKEHPQ